MSPRALAVVLACAAFGVAASPGCAGCGADALTVKKVLVDVDPAGVAAGVDRERVRAVVADVLHDLRGVEVDERAGAGAVLRVRVESFTSAPPPGTTSDVPAQMSPPASLSLAVEVVGAGGAALRGRSVASAHGVIEPAALVEQALRDAITQVQQIRAIDGQSNDELLAVLSSSSSTTAKRRAIQALGSRREPRATPALVALLQSGDTELAAAALQGLTLLADPSAVDAIIAYSERQPALVRKLCIDAARATGSPAAVPWLFTLSTGHPDAEVRAAAKAALAALAPPTPTDAPQTPPPVAAVR